MTTGSNGGGLGKLIAVGFALWAGARILEQSSGKSIWQLLDEYAQALAAQEHRRQAEEQRQRLLRALQEITAPRLPAPPTPPPLQLDAPWLQLAGRGEATATVSPAATTAAPQAPASPTYIPSPDAAWRQKIMHPSVILIVGKRGSGKSALGYRLLELFRYGARPYVVGVLASARAPLPEWLGIAPALEEVPPKAIALVDEAYLSYHARASRTSEALAMSQALNLSRQREQTILFVSQEARQVDRNIASSANVLVFKDLGILQLEFDRPELNKLAGQAREAFARVAGDKRRWSFVYAPDGDFLGLLENELPSFWKPSLSRLFAAVSAPAPPRAAKVVTPQEKAAKAKTMRAQGASLKTIADPSGRRLRVGGGAGEPAPSIPGLAGPPGGVPGAVLAQRRLRPQLRKPRAGDHPALPAPATVDRQSHHRLFRPQPKPPRDHL